MTNHPEARLSIVAYHAKPGRDSDLLALSRKHVPLLRERGLATERAHIVAKASDGTIVEIFEWASGGLARAHQDPQVSELWREYSEVSSFVPVSSLAEATQMFTNLTPID